MQIVYTEHALQDMLWFRQYYAKVFPEGRGTARASLLRTEALIVENPRIGHLTAQRAETREFPILRTPFAMLYRVRAGRIEILRLIDHRAQSLTTP